MALVNCPECGRNNVSDTAEQCPECGFAVKQHFDKQKEKEFLNSKKKQLLLEVEEEYKDKLNEIEGMTQPIKPLINFKKLILYISLIIVSVLFTAITKEAFVFIIAFILILISLFGLATTISSYMAANDNYKKNIKNWDKHKEFQKESLKREYQNYINNLDSYVNKPQNDLKDCSACHKQISVQAEVCPHCGQPTGVHVCPNCRSTNTKVITGTSKAASIAVWGVFAANKVKSNYECNDCGHKF